MTKHAEHRGHREDLQEERLVEDAPRTGIGTGGLFAESGSIRARRPALGILPAVLILAMACSDSTGGGPRHVQLPAATLSLGTGDSLRLTASVVNDAGQETGGTVTWSLADPHAAEIVNGEWLRGVRVGRGTLIASSGSATPDSAEVVVTLRLTSTTVRPDSLLLQFPGDTATLKATSMAYLEHRIGSYAWLSNDDGVATVTPQGLVRAVRAGTTYVLALEHTGTEDSALVRVETPLVSTFATVYGAPGLQLGGTGITLLHTVRDTLRLTVETSDTSVVEPSPAFVAPGRSSAFFSLTPRGIGTATVYISAPGYRPATGQVLIGRPQLRFSSVIYSSLPIRLPVSTVALYSARFESEYDSMRVSRTATDTVRVTLRSSDSTVFPGGTFVIPPGDSEASTGLRSPLKPGTVWLVWEAPGFIPDSLPFEFFP